LYVGTKKFRAGCVSKHYVVYSSSASEARMGFFVLSLIHLLVVPWWWVLTWTECSVLGGKPGHLRTSRTRRRPTCSRAHCDGLDGSYVASIHGGGIARWHTLISKRTAGGAHHVHSWMRSYPRDPTDPPIPRNPPLLLLALLFSSSFKSKSLCQHTLAKFPSLLFVAPVLLSHPSQVVSLVMHPSASSASSVALS